MKPAQNHHAVRQPVPAGPAGPVRPRGLALHLLVVLLLCAVAPFAHGDEALAGVSAATDGTAYAFPEADPLRATVFGTPPGLQHQTRLPAHDVRREVRIEGREVPDIFWYDRSLRYTLALQRGPAPLAFIIAGTGAGDNAGKMRFLTRLFHDAGYHCVALPSPTHMNFMVSMSHTRVAGYVPDDVADLYRVMRWMLEEVRSRVEVTGTAVTGYSLGGLHAAYLAKMDEERGDFGFRRVLMINPPASLFDSASRFDAWLSPEALGGTSADLFDRFFDQFADFYRKSERVGFDDEFLYRFSQKVEASPTEMRGVIGLSFRLTAATMIFTSDALHRSGYVIPKDAQPGPFDDLMPYFKAAAGLGFTTYLDEYMLPFLLQRQPDLTREAVIRACSLEPITGFLAHSPKIRAIGNADDPILTAGNLAYLKSTLGDRLTLFPTGGHCGNLNYGPFATRMVDLMNAEYGNPRASGTAMNSGLADGGAR